MLLKAVDRRNTSCEKWDGLKREFGREDLVPMWVADMDFASPDVVTDALAQRVAHQAYGYTIESGEDRQAVFNWLLERHNFKTRTETYLFSPGVMTSLRACVRALTSPGDGVLVQTPVYPPFIHLPKSLGRELIISPLKRGQAHGYEMDFEHLDRVLSRAKVMLLCSPHNPVGRVWREDELETLAGLCRKHNVTVIVDEIHHDFVYEGHRHTPFLKIGGLSNDGLAISCISATKTFNLAGLLCSTIIIENAELRGKIEHELNSAGIGVNMLGRLAQRTAYRAGAPWLDELNICLAQNRDHTAGFFAQNCPEVSVTALEGTYLMWLDFNAVQPDAEKLRRWAIDEARVGFSFGTAFGENGSGFLRLNIACPRKQLDEALERVATTYKKLQNKYT